MAEKIVGFRIKLEGEKATIDSLNTVRESLDKSAKALDAINKKSDALEKSTQKIKDLTAAVANLGNVNVSGGANSANNETQIRNQKRLRDEIEKTTLSQAELLKELQQIGDKSSPRYKELIDIVAKAKVAQAELTKEIKTQQKEFEGIKFAVGSYRQLDFELGKLRNTYKELSEAERTGAIGKDMQRNIQLLDRELKKLDTSVGQYQRNVGNYASAFNNLSTVVQRVSGVFGIAFGLDEVIRNNAQLSDSLGSVRRTASLSQESVEKLDKALRDIKTRTSLKDLFDQTIIGGKLGIAEKEIEGFVRATDKLQVALKEDLGGNTEQTIESLGKLATIFGDDLPKSATTVGEKMLFIGNSLDTLADSGIASGGFMVDFAQRLAGLNGIAEVTLPQILGLAAAFEANGQTVEVAATATQSLITQIASSPDIFAKLAGFVGQAKDEFINLINTNPVEALLQLGERLKSNNPLLTQFSGALKEAGLDGERVKGVLAVLGSKSDEFRTQIELGTSSLQSQSKILASYEISNNTAGAALDKFKKAIIDTTTSTEFQSFLFKIIEGFTFFIKILAGLPSIIKENRTEVASLIIAYLTFNTVLKQQALGNITASQIWQQLTGQIKINETATKLLAAAQRALPILLVIAAVYGLVKAFQSANAAVNANTVASDALAKAQDDIAAETGKASGELRRNIEILKSSITTDEQKQRAIQALQSQYPEYLKNIDLQSAGSTQLNKIEGELNKTLERQAAIKAKGAAQDEVLTQIIQKKNRIDSLREGGGATNEEQLRRGIFNVAQITNDKPTIAKGVISILEGDIEQLNKSLDVIDDRFNKRYNTELNRTQSIVNNNDLETYYNGVAKSISKTGETSEFVSKEDTKRRERAAKDLKKEDDERQKFERAAAENIFRIRRDLANKTAEMQKKEAALESQNAIRKLDLERADAEKKLSGTASEVSAQKAIYKGLYDTQVSLNKDLLTKKLNDINTAFEAERKAALADIEARRQDFILRQANNTVSNIQASGKAQNRVFELDTVTTVNKFENKESTIRTEFDKKADFSKTAEKELTRQLKQLTIERETELQSIEEQKFTFNKDLKTRELQAELTALDEKQVSELAKLDESEKQSRAKLDESFKNKILSVEEYDAALNELTTQTEAERAQIELDSINAKSDLAATVAIDSINAETALAEKKLQIAKDTDAQLIENAKKTADNERAIQAARLDFLQTFVSGAKDLLGQDEGNRKKYATVIKALALAEIGINLQRELSAIAVAAAANPTNVLTFGIAGITQYTVQSGIAILRAGFAAAKVLTSKLEYGGVEPTIPNHQPDNTVQGGSIPSESGVIHGKSHTEGGVKIKNRYGNLYEVEGGEYRLRNGSETYIINRGATRQNRSELDTLSKILRPSLFSAQRKAIASAINSSNGGVKFASGGIEPNGGVPFNTPLIGAPLPVQNQMIVVNTSSDSENILTAILDTQRIVEKAIKSTNDRIDRITVINKPEEVYDEALKQKDIRSTQNL